MAEILAQLVAELRRDYPDVPLAPGVDLDGIKAGDAEPFFITLPLIKVGSKSNNGFTWEQIGVQRVVNEINAKRPGGILGHVRPDERSSRYDLPRLQWVGAALVGGTAYGKAYVPKYAGDVREFMRVAELTKARVGTSVYGMRGPNGLADMTLESIDLGHPDRLGSPDAAAVPKITSEMKQGGRDVGETTDDKLVTELRSDRDAARQQVSELQGTISTQKGRIAELEQRDSTLTALVSELGLGEKPLDAAKALVNELKTLRADALKRQIGDVIVAEVKNEALRPYIAKLMIGVTSEAEAKTRVAELLADKDIQELAKKLVVEARGGSAYVGREGDGGDGKLKDTPENRQAARARMGF